MWLSYIVPVYNCDKYLERCINSLQRQGLNDDEYEIVIVDDGSTDGSLTIAERYASSFQNIRLYSQSNKGVGSARNLGIDKSRGEYISFVDSDDWILEGGISQLKEYIDFNDLREMYIFHSHTVDAKYDYKLLEKINEHKLKFDGTFKEYVESFGFGWCVWGKLIKRNFLIENNYRFSCHRIAEDLLFVVRMFESIDARVLCTDLNIYRYFLRSDSAVNTLDFDFNRQACDDYIDYCNIYSSMLDFGKYKHSVYDSLVHLSQLKLLTRMLSASRDLSVLKEIREKAFAAKAFPLQGNTKYDKAINFLISSPVLAYVFSVIYRRIFLQFIKPYIGRN